MYTVSVAEANARFSEILSHVEGGDEVVITRRGHPVARLAALTKPLQSVKSLASFRASMPASKTSTTKALRRMRDEGY
jgi:prevent-host-death family protein